MSERVVTMVTIKNHSITMMPHFRRLLTTSNGGALYAKRPISGPRGVMIALLGSALLWALAAVFLF